MTGYLHPAYAASLAEFGVPRALPGSGAWVLERPIADTAARDAMGCYPLFTCRDWSRLADDVEAHLDGLVSLVVVTDPFGAYDLGDLRRCFPDLVRPFKEHHTVDLEQPLDRLVHPHHRRNARRALRTVSAERVECPPAALHEWTALYDNLIARHRIRGIATFSRTSFREQLGVPGLVAFRAVQAGEVVGMVLWYVQNDVGYYHLAAYSDAGYSANASFALFWTAMEHFAGSGVRALDLGAGAGLTADPDDGLTRFKRGWSTGTRTAYLCGRILDPSAYGRLVADRGVPPTAFFPAYRQREHDAPSPPPQPRPTS
jgi:hypothetical protein